MARILTITNQKGGVGKTTTTVNLACALKNRGYNVLVIDMDPQGNLSFCANANTVLNATIYEVLKGEVKIQYAIQRTSMIDIIGSNILLSGIELEYTKVGREFLLKDALATIKNYYDIILIDTPPGLGILTINAMTASQGVIIPMVADIFSLQGITQLYESVEQVKKYSNPNLVVEGVLLNKYNAHIHLNREVKGAAELVLKDLGIKLFTTTIRSSIAVAEAQSSQQDLFTYSRKNGATLDFERFSKEVMKGESHVKQSKHR
jgi:chromosome partitioning protein